MIRKNRVSSCLIALLLVLPTVAQETPRPLYGDESELAGAKTVFINPDGELAAYQNTAAILAKKLPGLEIVDEEELADLVLLYVFDRRAEAIYGRLVVLKWIEEKENLRVLADFRDRKGSAWTPRLSTILTNRFVRVYKKHNP